MKGVFKKPIGNVYYVKHIIHYFKMFLPTIDFSFISFSMNFV